MAGKKRPDIIVEERSNVCKNYIACLDVAARGNTDMRCLRCDGIHNPAATKITLNKKPKQWAIAKRRWNHLATIFGFANEHSMWFLILTSNLGLSQSQKLFDAIALAGGMFGRAVPMDRYRKWKSANSTFITELGHGRKKNGHI